MQNLFTSTTLHAPGTGCAPCRPPRHDDPDGDLYGAPPPDPARPPPPPAPEAPPLIATVAVNPRQDPPPVASVATPRQDAPLVGIVVLPQQDSGGTTRFGALSGADAPTAFAPGAIAAVLKEGQARRDAPASTSRLGPISAADAPTAFAPGAIAAVLKSVRARVAGNPPLSSAGLAPAGALSEREMFVGMRLDEQSEVAREIAPEAADGVIGLLVLGAVDEAYEILAAAAAPTAPAGALTAQEDGDEGDHYGPSRWILAAGCLTSLSGEANDPRPAGAVLSTMRPSDARAHLAAAAADVEELMRLIERVNAQGVSTLGKSRLAPWMRPFADDLTRWQRMNGEGALALRADGQSLADAVARTKGALDADTAERVRAQREAASAVVANYRKGALSAAAMLAEIARGPGRLGYARAAAERLTHFDSPQARAANALALHVLTHQVHSNVYDATVARHQAGMGEVAADGYYGVRTRLRMLALGVGAPLGVGEAIASAGEVVTATQRQAAQALIDYVRATPTLRGNVYDATVARHQRAMGGITADGKYGLGTQGRIRAILGSSVAVPDAPTGPAPTAGASGGTGTAAQQAAARSLISYVNATPSLRSNVANDQVRAYQTAMGGLTADGKYGSGTQARIRALLGASTSVPTAPTSAAPAATTPAPTRSSSPTATTAPPATTSAPGGGGGGSVGTQINEVLQGTAAIIAALNPQARTSTEADTRLTELRAELEALNARGASAERDAQLQRALDQLTDLRAQVAATAADAANRLPGTTPPPASLFSSEVGGALVIGGAVVAMGVLGIMGLLVYSTVTRAPAGFQGGPERIGAGRGQQAQQGQFGYAA